MSEFVRTGELDFKELIRGILDDLLRLFTNQLYQQLVGLLSGGGGGGGLFGGGGGLFGGGGGLFGGGGFLGGLFGGGFGLFRDGGFTGNRGVNDPAGIVHGQEFVMNAQATRRNRPLLESLNNGGRVPVAAGGGSNVSFNQKVVVNNHSNAQVATRTNSNGDLEVMIREIANNEIGRQTPKLMANEQRNPNSRFSKAQGERTNTKRRR